MSFDVDAVDVDLEELLDRLLDLRVRLLAEVVEPDAACAVDEVERRPVAVVERSPDRELVVDDDGVVDLEVGDGSPDVREVVLEPELRGMNTDGGEASFGIALRPGADVRKRA